MYQLNMSRSIPRVGGSSPNVMGGQEYTMAVHQYDRNRVAGNKEDIDIALVSVSPHLTYIRTPN